jgi:hypothetical protein
MVASSSEFVLKAWSVTNGEREGHLNRAGFYLLLQEMVEFGKQRR